MADVCAYGLREGTRHGPMSERAEEPPFAVHCQVSCRPDRRRAHIAREDGVVCTKLVEHPDNILRVDMLIGWIRRGKVIKTLPCLPIVFDRRLQMLIVLVVGQPRKEGTKRGLRVPYVAVIDSCSSAELFATDVKLYNPRILGIELLIRKIRPNHQQDIAVHHRVIAGGESEKTRHPHGIRVVVFDEFLPAHRMYDRCLQPARECDQLRVSSGAARSTKDRYLL